MANGYVIKAKDLEEASTTRQQLADFLCVTHSRICQLLRGQGWRGDQYQRATAFLNMRRQRFAEEIKKDLINV